MVYTPDQKILLILLILSKEKVWIPGSGSGFTPRPLPVLSPALGGIEGREAAFIAFIETALSPRLRVYPAFPASLRETEFIALIATVLSPGSKFYPAVRPFNGRAAYSAVKNIAFMIAVLYPSYSLPLRPSRPLRSENIAFVVAVLYPGDSLPPRFEKKGEPDGSPLYEIFISRSGNFLRCLLSHGSTGFEDTASEESNENSSGTKDHGND